MTYTKCITKYKSLLLQSATAEQIKGHTEQVEQGVSVCCLPTCSRCGVTPNLFKIHEKRKRKFFVVVHQVVVTIAGLLSRWKCPGCRKTATDYPDFALPYKRYTLPTIQAFSQVYVQEPFASYRRLANNCPLTYEKKSDGQESMMEHSTIHRWISTLGRYSHLVQNATNLIFQADPTSCLCRDLASLKISPGKYRSSSRKQTLLTCFQLMTLEPVYLSMFQVTLFPKLATRSSYS